MNLITVVSLNSDEPEHCKVVKVAQTDLESLDNIWYKVNDDKEGLKFTSELLLLPYLLEDSRVVDVNKTTIDDREHATASFIVWVACVPNIGAHYAQTYMIQFFTVD